MAKARAIIKRRKAVENIRKITRTMELIATAKFRKALDRATEAEAFTRKIAELVADLGETSQTVTHPLLERRDPVKRSLLLVLTSNRGLAGGYNGNVLRLAFRTLPGPPDRGDPGDASRSPASAGINFFRFRKLAVDATYTQFEDRPQFDEVEKLADRTSRCTSRARSTGSTWPTPSSSTSARQVATVQTLLPIVTADLGQAGPSVRQAEAGAPRRPSRRTARPSAVPYEFLPDAQEHPRGDRARSRSRCGCSSASSTRPSASRSRGWSPCGGPPRTPTTS